MQFSDKEENYRLILIFGPPLRTINRGKDLAEWKNGATFVPGKLAEWSIAAVLKTVVLQGTGGSNPSLSAEEKQRTRELAHKELTLFYILKDWRFRKAFMRNPKRASLDSVPKSV